MKRGESGLSLLVAVNKPSGMTSHDVVNRCRRIFQERRVGHTGTLDPLASGVLPICVGPATRLDRYMVGNCKRYRVTFEFGYETTTDDVEGEPTVRGDASPDLLDGDFAWAYISGLVGDHDQVPPRYSAVKVNGTKAYEAARKGGSVDLKPRRISIYDARLIERKLGEEGLVHWVVEFSVSKGTYIRSIVRDAGRELGCPAHVYSLERLQSGSIALDDCFDLDVVERLKGQAALDPLRVLGFPYCFADDRAAAVSSGARISGLPADLFDAGGLQDGAFGGSCTTGLVKASGPLEDGGFLSVVVENKLKAIYRYDAAKDLLMPDCVFSTGIARA